jgi:membrane-associated protein
MPALAGISRMHYPRFLAFNAAGGLVWGAGFVLLGYLAGNSYETVAKTVGREITAVAIVIAIIAAAIWRIRSARRKQPTRGQPEQG